MKRPTMTDVANLAGVSQGTVSLVLNNVSSARIAKSTRERVLDAARSLATAQTEQAALKDRHERERLALLAQELGVERVRRDPIRARFIRPDREARNAHAQATVARREAENLRALPPEQAAALVEAKRAAAEQARQLAADRARRLRGTVEQNHSSTEPRRDGSGLGL